MKAIVKPTVALIGGIVGDYPVVVLLLACALLFVSLKYLTVVIRSLVMTRLEAFFDRYIFKTALRGMLFGLALTVLVQSSSIATSLAVPLAGTGLLTLIQIFPYTLGANIGTPRRIGSGSQHHLRPHSFQRLRYLEDSRSANGGFFT